MSVCGNGKRVLEDCSDLLSPIHITYETRIKTKYMYMRFSKLYVVVCLATALLFENLFILYLSQRAKGPLNICLFSDNCMQTWDNVKH